jgi:hypothetical protein
MSPEYTLHDPHSRLHLTGPLLPLGPVGGLRFERLRTSKIRGRGSVRPPQRPSFNWPWLGPPPLCGSREHPNTKQPPGGQHPNTMMPPTSF